MATFIHDLCAIICGCFVLVSFFLLYGDLCVVVVEGIVHFCMIQHPKVCKSTCFVHFHNTDVLTGFTNILCEYQTFFFYAACTAESLIIDGC